MNARVLEALSAAALLDDIGEMRHQPGATVLTGWSAFEGTSRFMLMGFNPAVDSEGPGRSIEEQTRAMPHRHSEYTSGNWTHPTRETRHQRQVRQVLDGLGLVAEDTPAVNAIFVRSEGAKTLEGPWQLFERCWPAHQRLLAHARPNVIVCLGYGTDLSAYALLVHKLKVRPNGWREKRAKAVRTAVGTLPLRDDELDVRLVGIKHPSYPIDVERTVAEVRAVTAGQS